MSISGVTTRDARYTADTDYDRPVVAGLPGAVCDFEVVDFDWVGTALLSSTTKQFTAQSISPTDVVKRGPNSNRYPISVKFTTATAIPDDG